jgi:hypothetical protein
MNNNNNNNMIPASIKILDEMKYDNKMDDFHAAKTWTPPSRKGGRLVPYMIDGLIPKRGRHT